jgi:hypothetical protein
MSDQLTICHSLYPDLINVVSKTPQKEKVTDGWHRQFPEWVICGNENTVDLLQRNFGDIFKNIFVASIILRCNKLECLPMNTLSF